MLERIGTMVNEMCPQYFHLDKMLEDQETKRHVRDRICF